MSIVDFSDMLNVIISLNLNNEIYFVFKSNMKFFCKKGVY